MTITSIQSRSIFTPPPGQIVPKVNALNAPMLALHPEIRLEVHSLREGLYLFPVSQESPESTTSIEGAGLAIPALSTPALSTPALALPPLEESISRYVLGLVEIFGGRRQPMQLARLSHRIVYAKIVALAGTQREIPKIRRVYISEPAQGVSETTVTLRIKDRVRSLALRFEGSDKRWLCTELVLL